MNTPTLSKKCLVCGNIFYKKPSCSLKRWQTSKKFCSISCRTEAKIGCTPWNKDMTYSPKLKKRLNMSGLEKGWGYFQGKKRPEISGDKHPMWKPHVSKSCKHCKKEMLLPQWDAARRFCSVTCWGFGHRGINSPVFKGEQAYTPLRTRIMQLPEYVEWRTNVFKRDGYACILCRKKGYLEADHIKTYASIIRENKITSPAEARECTELWNTENGRTLCRECHRKSDTHGLRGRKVKV